MDIARVCNNAGEVLTWFGRDLEYEDKRIKWETGGQSEKEPEEAKQ